MGQTLCCRADNIDDLIEKNSSFSSSVSSAGQPLFLDEDNFNVNFQQKPLLNSPANYTTRYRSAASTDFDNGYFNDSPLKGKRKLNYSMSAKPLYFFPRNSIHSFCFDNFVREYCLGWTSSNIEKSINVPETIEIQDWIVVNLIAIYNDLCVFVSIIECKESTCPKMCAGKGRCFSYDFGDTNLTKPENISAISYMHRVIDCVTKYFDDPQNTYDNKEKIASLFTRSFAHILHNHFPDFIKQGYEHLFINSLKRFCYFVERYSLSTVDDFESIKPWFKHHKERDHSIIQLKYDLL